MRKIRTKQESMDGAATLILFCGVWYSSIFQDILCSESLGPSMLLFAAAGIMPAVIAVQKIQKAFYYRKLHRQAMNRSPEKGRIISYERQMQRKVTAKGRVHEEYEYRLVIEVYDNISYAPRQILSEPYSWPVYEVLGSPEVDVYTDDSGWHYVIDGFRYKNHRSDDGIFQQSAWEKGPEKKFSRVIIIVENIVLICMLIYIWVRK